MPVSMQLVEAVRLPRGGVFRLVFGRVRLQPPSVVVEHDLAVVRHTFQEPIECIRQTRFSSADRRAGVDGGIRYAPIAGWECSGGARRWRVLGRGCGLFVIEVDAAGGFRAATAAEVDAALRQRELVRGGAVPGAARQTRPKAQATATAVDGFGA